MKKIIITLLAVLSFQSCGLFQKTQRASNSDRSSADQFTEIKDIDHKRTDQELRIVSLSRDSSESRFQLMIWPKGRFTLSAEKGFEGEAEKVSVSGIKSRLQTASIDRHQQQETTDVKQTTSQQQVHYRQDAKQTFRKAGPSLNWMIPAGLLLALIAGYYLLKR